MTDAVKVGVRSDFSPDLIEPAWTQCLVHDNFKGSAEQSLKYLWPRCLHTSPLQGQVQGRDRPVLLDVCYRRGAFGHR